jgi:hypothetical protein
LCKGDDDVGIARNERGPLIEEHAVDASIGVCNLGIVEAGSDSFDFRCQRRRIR